MTEEQPKELDIDSKDIMGENLEKLKEMFPSVVKDGTVDVEALRNVIGDISEPNQEYYNFTWAGKSEAFKVIKEKTTATLKPMKSDDESVDFENTENIFIEGDNLEVLKILQKTYHNSIKMIYIDPPYNKDKDFVYPDKWSEGLTSYLEYSKLVDEEGNITSSSAEDKNVKAGRKHSRWLTMMYPRLFLARNLLKDDGAIFISIDDAEDKNLKMLCDEIFGEENFINKFVWKKNSSGKTVSEKYPENIDYIYMYVKGIDYKLQNIYKPLAESSKKMYSKDDNDGRGKYATVSLQKTGSPGPQTTYDYIDNSGKVWLCPAKGWRLVKEKVKALEDDNRLYMNGSTLREKDYWNERDNEGQIADTLWDDLAENNVGTAEVNKLLDKEVFSNPKPTDLIKRCLNIITNKDDVILDFFSGSGTTAHSVMNLNAKDGGQRKCISVQLPEHLEKKEQKKAINFLKSINKPTNIAEITKERIRRVGQKIKDENSDSNVDTGLKVFKLSESNFKQWDDTPKSKAELQLAFEEYKDNVKDGSNQLDMLYEVILAKGLSLNSKVQEIEVSGKKMFKVDSDGVELLACFEDEITAVALDEVINLRPIYFICLDSSFKSGSALKTNSVLRFRDADILFETV